MSTNSLPDTSSSLKLPMYSCLIILVLGALLHLGWNAVTRTAVDETKEREILRVLGRWIEEAVDSIVEAAFQDFAAVDPLFP